MSIIVFHRSTLCIVKFRSRLRVVYIPEELWDTIIKLIGNRKQALTTATFVCKHWRDLTLPYLYGVVTVDLWQQPSKSFSAFFEFIRQRPTIAACIKELHLSGFLVGAREYNLDIEIFVAILPSLSALHTLSIKHVTLRVSDRITQALAADNRFPFPLRKLTVCECASAERTGYLDTFSTFLSLFRADTLQVGGLLVPGNCVLPVRAHEPAAWRPQPCIFTNDLVIGLPMISSRKHMSIQIARFSSWKYTDIDTAGFFARLVLSGDVQAISIMINFSCQAGLRDLLCSPAAQNIVSVDLNLCAVPTVYLQTNGRKSLIITTLIWSDRDVYQLQFWGQQVMLSPSARVSATSGLSYLVSFAAARLFGTVLPSYRRSYVRPLVPYGSWQFE